MLWHVRTRRWLIYFLSFTDWTVLQEESKGFGSVPVLWDQFNSHCNHNWGIWNRDGSCHTKDSGISRGGVWSKISCTCRLVLHVFSCMMHGMFYDYKMSNVSFMWPLEMFGNFAQLNLSISILNPCSLCLYFSTVINICFSFTENSSKGKDGGRN